MVLASRFFAAATLLAGFASALPRPGGYYDYPKNNEAESAATTSTYAHMPAAETPMAHKTTEEYTPKHSPTHKVEGEKAAYTTAAPAHNTPMPHVTTTSTSMASHTTVVYGSGSEGSKYNQEYDDCVQQCVAKYPSAPKATYTATPVVKEEAKGTGVTHTVMVAPTLGVFRFVPFAVNASIGDTVKFSWANGNHTVTKSSQLLPCNKTQDQPFDSGFQVAGFNFDQVVNGTEPTYFQCSVGTHCEVGMFGVLNPASAAGAPTSVAQLLPAMAANSSELAAHWAYSKVQTAAVPAAATWGQNIDLGALPEWAHRAAIDNVLATRLFLAANPETIKPDGSVSLESASGTPLVIPQEISEALLAKAPNAAPPASSNNTTTTNPETVNQTSGAVSLSSSKMLVGVIVALATFVMM